MLPRLVGSSDALSRLGGGIGTRGPGETKLETDRRRIRHRISALKREIAEVQRRRRYLRDRRRRSDVPIVALVGYTNAGKTTLFNWLTGADAVASDALFVTLDPLMRRVRLGDARQMLLPTRSGSSIGCRTSSWRRFTGRSRKWRTPICSLHVIDASAVDRDRRAAATRRVLAEIGAEHVPAVEVFNKTDLLSPAGSAGSSRDTAAGGDHFRARRHRAVPALLDRVAGRLEMDAERVTLEFDDTQEADRRLVADLYRHAKVVSHVTDGQSRVDRGGRAAPAAATIPPRHGAGMIGRRLASALAAGLVLAMSRRLPHRIPPVPVVTSPKYPNYPAPDIPPALRIAADLRETARRTPGFACSRATRAAPIATTRRC